MIESAVILLAKQGYRATSFDAVLTASGASRGSIYHHFPGGKDELIAAAMDLAGQRAILVLDKFEGQSPPAVVDGFMAMWRTVLDRSAFSAGCSVLAVTVSAETPELRDRAGEIFRAWRSRLAELFVAGGLAPNSARAFATTVVAASEGAVAQSRAERRYEPFDEVRDQLHDFAAGLVRAAEGGL
ncbi:MAG TPA: TetR/AcrR family transcriptional regulator [Candidatus Limnocylindrales bacterium]|jgi:AcrR family transcriptional regulator